ncbi:hypothetical protein [Prosthecobacter sp.]|jgi:hypothetical protein|uniref:hypothetical protein n=1 Tax=Prosthecobacter sp. TaxID=1965333 RepID=UPI0037848CD0
MQPARLLVIFVFAAVHLCHAETVKPQARDDDSVGGRMIKLPPPTGFQRIDGLNPEKDRLLESMLAASNRYLARFEPLQANAADASRSFNAQVLRSLENREIGDRTFAEMKQQTKKELDQARATIEAEIAKLKGKAEKAMQDATGADAALSVSDLAVLGYFGETPNSLGFTMAMNVEARAGDNTNKLKGVIASMIVPVNGRLIYLYANADFKSQADRQWAEKAVTDWRDAVLAANPRVEGPPASRSIFDGVGRSAIIGAIAGVIGGLVAMLLRKKRKA